MIACPINWSRLLQGGRDRGGRDRAAPGQPRDTARSCDAVRVRRSGTPADRTSSTPRGSTAGAILRRPPAGRGVIHGGDDDFSRTALMDALESRDSSLARAWACRIPHTRPSSGVSSARVCSLMAPKASRRLVPRLPKAIDADRWQAVCWPERPSLTTSDAFTGKEQRDENLTTTETQAEPPQSRATPSCRPASLGGLDVTLGKERVVAGLASGSRRSGRG